MAHMKDARLRIPNLHLTPRRDSPTPEMLKHIDTLVVDLQTRHAVYTFEWTTALALEAARRKKVIVVLDRPEPSRRVEIGGN